MTRRRLLILASLASLLGCEDPAAPPGVTTTVRLRAAYAALSAGELSEIATFLVELEIDGRPISPAPYLSSDLARWDKPPPTDLPTSGALRLRLRAHDAFGRALPVGGSAGPIDLGAVPRGASRDVKVLIARLDAFTPLDATLATARMLHQAALAAEGLLVVGGVTGGPREPPYTGSSFAPDSEWIDPFSGDVCTSANPSCATWGDVPVPRVEQVMLALRGDFADSCPGAGSVLVAYGRAADGSALADAYLFDPEAIASGAPAFRRLDGLGLTARVGAAAVATPDCTVVVSGGHDGAGAAVDTIDVLELTGSGSVRRVAQSARLAPASSFGAPVRILSDELIVAGGVSSDVSSSPTVVSSSARLTIAAGAQVTACDLSSCEGVTPACARPYPRAVLLDIDQVDWPGVYAAALYVGATAGCAASPELELFCGGTTANFYSWLPVIEQPTSRLRGHTASPLLEGRVLLVGGVAADGSLAEAEIVAVSPTACSAQRAVTSLTPLAGAQQGLSSPLAFHAVAQDARMIAVAGGWDGTAASARVEVYVPSP